MEKWEVYIWLQAKLGLDAHQTHIGQFSEYMCEQVISLCQQAPAYTSGRADMLIFPQAVKLSTTHMILIDQLVLRNLLLFHCFPEPGIENHETTTMKYGKHTSAC